MNFPPEMHKPIGFGPDAAHMWAMAEGVGVPRPFYLRWLLPRTLRQRFWLWWCLWAICWPVIALGSVWWALETGLPVGQALLTGGLVVGLPGILGPREVIPVGVDLPATAVTIVGVAALEAGWWPVAVMLLIVAACIKESAPVWATLWTLNPVALIGLIAPAVRATIAKPALSPLGAMFDDIAQHPVRTALPRHIPHLRDAWWFVAPFGVTLIALYDPSWQLVLVLVVAHGQLLVATDHVRLVGHAAGPFMALTAASLIGVEWAVVAFVAHFFWWRTPQRG